MHAPNSENGQLDAIISARIQAELNRLSALDDHGKLGVAPGAGPDEIGAAYQRAAKDMKPECFSEYGSETRALAAEVLTLLTDAQRRLGAGPPQTAPERPTEPPAPPPSNPTMPPLPAIHGMALGPQPYPAPPMNPAWPGAYQNTPLPQMTPAAYAPPAPPANYAYGLSVDHESALLRMRAEGAERRAAELQVQVSQLSQQMQMMAQRLEEAERGLGELRNRAESAERLALRQAQALKKAPAMA